MTETQVESMPYHATGGSYTNTPSVSELDTRRIDDIHLGMKEYMDGNFIAPLSDPKRILDLGAGSGIWAAEMAVEFPKAWVLGVDILPVNRSHKPPNCHYQIIDLAKSFPFPPQSFDVIHTRFFLMHVPRSTELLQKIGTALRPGGFLLCEEGSQGFFAASGVPVNVSNFFKPFNSRMSARSVDPEIGLSLEKILEETGAFSEVRHVHITPPLCPWSEDERLNRLGVIMKEYINRVCLAQVLNQGLEGITSKVIDDLIGDMNDPDKKLYMTLNWVWARKP